MMMNSYTEQMLAQHKQKDMLAQAERERLVTQIIRWIKQDAQDERKTNAEMQVPEISLYRN
jgi:hypothetical protein